MFRKKKKKKGQEAEVDRAMDTLDSLISGGTPWLDGKIKEIERKHGYVYKDGRWIKKK